MNREHFIKNIEIKNFKCFKDFRAEGFGRVNLIGGKNNVGKTAFMEACYLSQSESTKDLFGKLLEIKTHRDVINNLLFKSDREKDLQKLIKENINIEIYIKGKGGEEATEEYYQAWDDGLIKIEYKGIFNIYTKYSKLNATPIHNIKTDKWIYPSYPDKYKFSDLIDFLNINFDDTRYKFSLNFISPYSNSNEELENIIGQSKLDDKYDELNQYLLDVFNVSSIDIIKNKPMLKVNKSYKDLFTFGQGIKTFINIIGSMLLLKNSYIFVDELENGIHYSHLDRLWEIILTISKEQNVQLFATTHSKECIESYARVAKKLEDKEITFIELCKREEEIKAFIYPYDWFIDEIEQEHEVRGCL